MLTGLGGKNDGIFFWSFPPKRTSYERLYTSVCVVQRLAFGARRNRYVLED